MQCYILNSTIIYFHTHECSFVLDTVRRIHCNLLSRKRILCMFLWFHWRWFHSFLISTCLLCRFLAYIKLYVYIFICLTFSILTYILLIFLVKLANLALYSQTKVNMKFILLLILIKINHSSQTVVDMKSQPLPVVVTDTEVEKVLAMLKLCECDPSTY